MEKHPRFDALLSTGKVYREHIVMRLFGQKCEKATWLYSSHDFLKDSSFSETNRPPGVRGAVQLLYCAPRCVPCSRLPLRPPEHAFLQSAGGVSRGGQGDTQRSTTGGCK
eukprot:7833749-Alexandrium_andersonii.AAC.1